jgi:conjugative transfer signal peptidase TraF
MKPLSKKINTYTAFVGAGVVVFGLICLAAGARVNTSKSIPVGLYWTSDKPADKGEYVLFCPPQIDVIDEAKRRGYLTAGFCPGTHGYLMKRIVGVHGDNVKISDDGVTVNGTLLPLSVPLRFDRAGRPLQPFKLTNFFLSNSEVLLMSDVSGTSFDGRYFGPVNRAQIESVIVPVFTW